MKHLITSILLHLIVIAEEQLANFLTKIVSRGKLSYVLSKLGIADIRKGLIVIIGGYLDQCVNMSLREGEGKGM